MTKALVGVQVNSNEQEDNQFEENCMSMSMTE